MVTWEQEWAWEEVAQEQEDKGRGGGMSTAEEAALKGEGGRGSQGQTSRHNAIGGLMSRQGRGVNGGE